MYIIHNYAINKNIIFYISSDFQEITYITNKSILITFKSMNIISFYSGWTLNKYIKALCIKYMHFWTFKRHVTPCLAVDGFPQPAFDGLWPVQDLVLLVPDTLHYCVFPGLDTAVLSHQLAVYQLVRLSQEELPALGFVRWESESVTSQISFLLGS